MKGWTEREEEGRLRGAGEGEWRRESSHSEVTQMHTHRLQLTELCTNICQFCSRMIEKLKSVKYKY